jgi:hypothetical protein
MKKRGITKNKKALELEMLAWWILGIAILVIIFIALFILKGKGVNAIEYIKELLRGR